MGVIFHCNVKEFYNLILHSFLVNPLQNNEFSCDVQEDMTLIQISCSFSYQFFPPDKLF